VDWLFESGSYLGIFLFMVLTGCGMPLPEEVAIVFAGVQSSQRDLWWPAAFASCLLGALVGDAVMYGLGRRFGHSLLRRKPKLAWLLHAEREKQFEQAIERHGFKVMLLARFMVGVRGPAYLAAGVVRMPFRRFLVWDSVCASVVVGAFFAVSYYFGKDIARLLRDAEAVFTRVAVGVVAVIAYVALPRHRRRLLARVLEVGDEKSGADGDASKPTAEAREAL
jgi:membrane protein DedA with SNARE-associated domain